MAICTRPIKILKVSKKLIYENVYNNFYYRDKNKYSTNKEDNKKIDLALEWQVEQIYNKIDKKIVFGRIKQEEYAKYYERCDIPCGKCPNCRLNHAGEWATRCTLEKKYWNKSCFVTLTYNGENLPKNRTLVKKDLQDFLKRLRYYHKGDKEWVNPQSKKAEYPIRYVACGEYGPNTLRPHYHLAIFNWQPTDLKEYKKNHQGDMLYTSKELEKIWGKGFVIIGALEQQSAGYVARYCTKKINSKIKIKNKMENEFIVMSRNGGIGIQYWNENKEKIIEHNGIYLKGKNKVQLKPIPKYYKKKWKEQEEKDITLAFIKGRYAARQEENKIKIMEYWKEWEKTTNINKYEYLINLEEVSHRNLQLLRRSNIP